MPKTILEVASILEKEIKAIENSRMKAGTITERDYIKAVRRADRLREIEQYGKVVSTRPATMSPSKKAYNRKRDKKIWESK